MRFANCMALALACGSAEPVCGSTPKKSTPRSREVLGLPHPQNPRGHLPGFLKPAWALALLRGHRSPAEGPCLGAENPESRTETRTSKQLPAWADEAEVGVERLSAEGTACACSLFPGQKRKHTVVMSALSTLLALCLCVILQITACLAIPAWPHLAVSINTSWQMSQKHAGRDNPTNA